MLLEPVQGEGGVNPADAEYFQGVRRLCDERGLLFIVDEVQTGFGRTGRWFGHQHFGVRPDVVTMAKALGNGVPIGACWARREVAAAFEPGDHATTFGGTPIATAAARAVLAELQRIDAPAAARARRRAPRSTACGPRRASRGPRPRPAARRRARRRARRQGGGRRAASTPGWSSTRSRATALRLAPPLNVSATPRSTRRSAVLGKVLAVSMT